MDTLYDREYYEWLRPGVRRSAEAVVPLIVDLVRPASVVDVGCGTGTWVAVFSEHGVSDVLGIDGDWVRPFLEIPESRFRSADISAPVNVGRSFDLAVCLEVAEHLPETSARVLITSLTRASSLVLFSAAVPGQAGTGHVNLQWAEYWARLFAEAGYVPVDYVRRRIWRNDDVDWWYIQNTLIYAATAELESIPALGEEHRMLGHQQLSLIHPRHFDEVLALGSWPPPGSPSCS